MDANPFMYGRHADILPQGLQSMPRRTPRWEYMQSSATVIKTAFQWKILDQCINQSRLMTLEALYIRTLKSAINKHDEYRTRELTLKASFGDKNPT